MGLNTLDYCLTTSYGQKYEMVRILSENGVPQNSINFDHPELPYLYFDTRHTICDATRQITDPFLSQFTRYEPLEFMRKALDNPNWVWPDSFPTPTSKKFTDYGKIKLPFP